MEDEEEQLFQDEEEYEESENGHDKKKNKKGGFRYCMDCNNLLYPREDKVNRKLKLACRNCTYEEDAMNPCVYRHEIIHAPSEQTMVVSDLSQDPTLPRANVPCPVCDHPEAVFFQSTSRRVDAKMTLFYICGNKSCGHRWTG